MSKIASIFKMTCPKCHGSKLFQSPFKFSDPLAMNKRCTVCNQRFEPEPGFYFGAMFISYIFLGFLSLGLTGLLVFYFHFSVDLAFAILLGFLAIIFLWNLRFSRSLWIHAVIKFDAKGLHQTDQSSIEEVKKG